MPTPQPVAGAPFSLSLDFAGGRLSGWELEVRHNLGDAPWFLEEESPPPASAFRLEQLPSFVVEEREPQPHEIPTYNTTEFGHLTVRWTPDESPTIMVSVEGDDDFAFDIEGDDPLAIASRAVLGPLMPYIESASSKVSGEGVCAFEFAPNGVSFDEALSHDDGFCVGGDSPIAAPEQLLSQVTQVALVLKRDCLAVERGRTRGLSFLAGLEESSSARQTFEL